MRTLAIVGIGLGFALLGLGMFFAPSAYEVVETGRNLRPYDSGEVYKIRLADQLTVYAAGETKPNTDSISGSALVALATAALMTSLLLGAIGGLRRLRAFYAIAAAGFAFLAFDEFFAVHETIGHNLVFLADLPGVERPDDLIIALYLIPAAAFLFYFRDVLTASRRAVGLFVAAIGAFLFVGLSDLAGVAADEPFEILSAACIAAGFVSLIVVHLTTALAAREHEPTRQREPTPEREPTSEREPLAL
jgi:hypothetical protein